MAAKKTANTTTRRKVILRATHVAVPTKAEGLSRLSTPELKNMLRAAGIAIPKTKPEMILRLAASDAVAVAVTTEAVVFGKPMRVRAA